MNLKERDSKILELERRIKEKELEMKKCIDLSNTLNARQLAYKIVLNAEFGSLANKHFVMFCNKIAEAITKTGQSLIQHMESTNEQYWYEMFHKDKELHKNVIIFKKVLEYIEINNLDKESILSNNEKVDEIITKLDLTNITIPEITKIDDRYIRVENNSFVEKPIKSEVYVEGLVKRVETVSAYVDTDSVEASSILHSEMGSITIEDYYNNCLTNKKDIEYSPNGHEIIICDDSRTILNYNKGVLYNASVKKVIRHKVSKKRWKIKTVNGKEIYVTGDHSMVVFRDNVQIVVKPYEILKTDKILSLVSITDFILGNIEECVMVEDFFEEYVYDIEMNDDTHTFIANDILVHNSLFVCYKPALKKFNITENQLDFVHYISRTRMKDFFKEKLDEYAKKYKVENKMDFEMEQISKSIIYLEKKMYVKNVVWEEGVYSDPETNIQAKGIDLVRSSSPVFIRDKERGVYKIIKYFFKNPETYNDRELTKLIKSMKDLFKLEPIENISMTTSCSNYNTKVIDDQESLKVVLGAHHAVKAAALHNYLLNQNSEYKKKYNLIKSGQKVKYYYTSNSLNSEFAYVAGQYPKEIGDKYAPIDYDTQFEKCVLNLVNRFNAVLGLSKLSPKLTFTWSLF